MFTAVDDLQVFGYGGTRVRVRVHVGVGEAEGMVVAHLPVVRKEAFHGAASFRSTKVWTDVTALPPVESRLDVDYALGRTVKDGGGVLAHQRRHEACRRNNKVKKRQIYGCCVLFAEQSFQRRHYHHEVEEAQG